MTAEQLSKLIQLSVRKVMKEEFATMKREILSELHRTASAGNPLKEQQVKFRQKFQVNQPKRTTYVKDPILNEILKTTQPVQEDPLDMYEDMVGDMNVPTNEAGMPITNVNPAIMEAMNKNYSGMFAKQERSDLRNKYNSIINQSEPLDDDEEFGFLKQLG